MKNNYIKEDFFKDFDTYTNDKKQHKRIKTKEEMQANTQKLLKYQQDMMYFLFINSGKTEEK